MAYDIAEAFEDIEMSLIQSMRRNMQRHINEEYDEGLNWTQWQAEMLDGLSQYRAENKAVLKGYMGKVNAEIDAAIREAYTTGESEQEIEVLKAIKRGYNAPKSGNATINGRFFRTNQNKLNALVKATTKDMKKAETALLRMTDDVYRKTLFKAQMFYNTGAGNMWQCIDMATKDFLSAGINCVQYKNGARVNIASYAEMSLRTANKRANLMGQANTRERWGIHTVKVNARGIACPMCLQWLDKVYIDDVYGGGTAAESAKLGYPLLSTAVEGGLYHPNCKDSCSTYYPGISREPQEITKDQEKETLRRYNLEQKQRYYERNYKRNMRLGNGCLDQTNADKYFRRARICKDKLIDLCDSNSDVLRLDKARLSLRGILSVDNAGRISIADVLNTPVTSSDKYYDALLSGLKQKGVEYKAVTNHLNKLSNDDIISALAGGDRTKGSCASLGLAYIGQQQGWDIVDFRGGDSLDFFSSALNLLKLSQAKGVKTLRAEGKSSLTVANRLLKQVEKDKEYYLCVGQHAAIVRRTDDALQYLELQDAIESGWTNFDGNPRYTLSERFGCKQSIPGWADFMIDINESDFDNDEFKSLLGYINTEKDKQKKGVSGYRK